MHNVLPPSSLPGFLSEWVDVDSNHCVYTALQVQKFPQAHLLAGAWYLDCSRGFVPDVERGLYDILVGTAPEVIEFEEEPEEEIPAPKPILKDVVPVKSKGKGRRLNPKSSSQVSTRSYTKASVQPSAAPATTVVGSPSATPSAPAPYAPPAPSHSGATIPSVPRKRKAVAPDTSATSAENSTCHSLIENVDMVDLIEDLMKSKIQPPAYRRIQEFIAKVYFQPLALSFHTVTSHFIFFLVFVLLNLFACFFVRLEPVVLVQTPSLSFTRVSISSSQMFPRICVCQTSLPHCLIFHVGTSVLLRTLKFCLPSLMPTSMTTVSSSLHMPLILRSLVQFTIGHTLRNSTLPRIGLA